MVRVLYYLAIYLFFIGLAISSYLLIVYTSNAPLPCSLSHGCDEVRYSPYSHILGVPVPLFGVGFYLLAIILSFISLKKHRFRYLFAVWLLTAWGLLFASYLTYLEAYVIQAWCSWCVLNAVVNVLTFILVTRVVWSTGKIRTVSSILLP